MLSPASSLSSNARLTAPRADDFTGRNDELEFLSTRLCQPDKHTRVAVVGLGGIG